MADEEAVEEIAVRCENTLLIAVGQRGFAPRGKDSQ